MCHYTTVNYTGCTHTPRNSYNLYSATHTPSCNGANYLDHTTQHWWGHKCSRMKSYGESPAQGKYLPGVCDDCKNPHKSCDRHGDLPWHHESRKNFCRECHENLLEKRRDEERRKMGIVADDKADVVGLPDDAVKLFFGVRPKKEERSQDEIVIILPSPK